MRGGTLTCTPWIAKINSTRTAHIPAWMLPSNCWNPSPLRHQRRQSRLEWAAFEALLSEPGNHAVVADRMGAIVACSFPRAELTVLSHQAAKSDLALAARLDTRPTNRDRAEMIAAEIAAPPNIALPDVSDQASYHRMKKLSANPHGVLKDSRRLYDRGFSPPYSRRSENRPVNAA